ncbi:MAG: hypothetical protein PHW33_00625 [Candidatus Portnoybacteria bacterium]|jgi:hypothetical protein|nr:hypothetical protein [Candidatus Portnoybacteria bacterium]
MNTALTIIISVLVLACVISFPFLLLKKKKEEEKKKRPATDKPAATTGKPSFAWRPSQAVMVNVGVLTIIAVVSAAAFWDKFKALPAWAIAALIAALIILFIAGIGADAEKSIKRGRGLALVVLALGLFYFWSGDLTKAKLMAPTGPTVAQKTTLPAAVVDTNVSAAPGQVVRIDRLGEAPPVQLFARDESGQTFSGGQWAPKYKFWRLRNTGTERIKIFVALPSGGKLSNYRFSVTPSAGLDSDAGKIKPALATKTVLSPASPSGNTCPFDE